MRRFAILGLCLLAFGCKRKPAIPPDVIVRVSDRMVTLADFKRYVERNTGTELAQMGPEVASAMLDQYIEQIVLSEYAARHGVEVPAEQIADAVRNEAGATVVEKRDEMRKQKLVAQISSDVVEPSEAEVRRYYDEHRPDFRSNEEVRVRQILVHDETLANNIISRLKKGASFEELSVEHSRAPNAKRGGEIGYVSRGELPKMFEDEIFAISPGSTSRVIRTDNSVHIFKVEGRRPAGEVDVATATPLIRQRLREDAIRERMAQLVSKVRTEMPIAVLTKRLPFGYAGTFPKSDNE